MEPSETKSCSRCFFTTQFPGTVIEENGHCNFCNSTDFVEMKRKQVTGDLEGLRRRVQELKDARAAKNGKYDCIIGASGGLDSSYVIYVAKKLLDLNPLVVKYDHGFSYDIANQNLKALCESLGVDYKVIKSERGFDKKCFKYRVLALRLLGIYWGVCTFCGWGCNAAILREAIRNKIGWDLGNSNLYELVDLERPFKVKSMIKAFLHTNPLKWPLIGLYLSISQYYLLRLKLEIYVPPLKNIFRRMPRIGNAVPGFKMQGINISYYIPWDLNNMLKTLESETGWRAPEPPRLPMRYDCRIEEGFVNHTRKESAGITIHAIISNRLIADGLGDKEKFQKSVELYDKEIDIQMKKIEEELGIPRK